MKMKLVTFALALSTAALTGCMEPYAKTQQRAHFPDPHVPSTTIKTPSKVEAEPVTHSTLTRVKATPIATTPSAPLPRAPSRVETRSYNDDIEVLKPVEAPAVESAPITIDIN